MNKLKIGLFVDYFYPAYGVVVNYVNILARKLNDSCDVTVFCPETQPDEYYEKFPYKIVRCQLKSNGRLDGVHAVNRDQKFFATLAQTKLDLVHIHTPFSIGKLAYRHALEHNIPIITSFHNQFKMDLYRQTKSIIFANLLSRNIAYWANKSDEIWAPNQAMVDLLEKKYKLKVTKKIIPNFTDHEIIKYDEKRHLRKQFNDHYNIYERTKLLLFVGRLNKLKNPFFLVKMAKILKKMSFQFKLIFVGDGVDEKKIRDKVKRNHLENYVLFLGRMESAQLVQMYAIADLLVCPSKYDASSLVQMEAAMQFLPTIFLNDALTASSVSNNITGFTTKDNPYDYALRILEIFHSKQLYLSVKEHCHNICKTWDQVKDEIYSGYLDVIKNHAKKPATAA